MSHAVAEYAKLLRDLEDIIKDPRTTERERTRALKTMHDAINLTQHLDLSQLQAHLASSSDQDEPIRVPAEVQVEMFQAIRRIFPNTELRRCEVHDQRIKENENNRQEVEAALYDQYGKRLLILLHAMLEAASSRHHEQTGEPMVFVSDPATTNTADPNESEGNRVD
ncbi:hypothetical protein BJ508DRAFT_334080 [Ascobolus immersus RN42]|uniref:Uncharacterized protein n=1 Tax=Ascobolus immersus RN42 TaxID=1160509 RepID=A0A3N4HUT4_ASCIM|nr:hypothetical protein BJ508DRAFT_334080 [Ascobolus immersus RN42]